MKYIVVKFQIHSYIVKEPISKKCIIKGDNPKLAGFLNPKPIKVTVY